MRIVFINYCAEPEGNPEQVIELHRTQRCIAESLNTRKHEVCVINLFSGNHEMQRNGVRYLFVAGGSSLSGYAPRIDEERIHTVANSVQPDIVHIQSLRYYRQARMLRAALPRHIPIVMQHHAERPARFPFSLLQRSALRSIGGVLFNGAGNATEWIRAGVIHSAEKVFEVPEGSTGFSPVRYSQARMQTGMQGSPAVLFVARLEKIKDPMTAVDGFAHFQRRLPEARLYMIFREGALSATIRDRIARDERLSSHVTLVGEVAHHELPAWYSAADLFLTAGKREGSNYALIEAMSCGAYPVCSDIPPHRYLTGDGRHGTYFAAGDPAACATALQTGMENASQISRQTRVEYFASRLSFDAIATRLEEIYSGIIRRTSNQ